MTLNGRPEDNSISGAKVKLLRRARAETFAGSVRRSLEDAASDPAMALVVHGVGPLKIREARVLRLEGGLQVGGIVQ